MDSSDLLGGEDTCKFFVYCFEACLRIQSSTRFDAVSKTTMTQDAKETKKKEDLGTSENHFNSQQAIFQVF